jgi:uncharacterized protein (TIGR02001 family)
MTARLQRIAGSAAAAAATLMLLAGPVLADGYKRGSLKDPPKPEERCKHSANVALTTDYVFRGISQTKEGPAIQGGYDLTCGIFYAGVWASNLDWGGTGLFGLPGNSVANIEMDWYLGIKPVTGHITWDLGVIYYSYPNAAKLGLDAAFAVDRRDYNYLELKVGASTEIWKDGTVGVTVFYSPEYQYEAGSVWTTEASFTQVFPKFSAIHREWTPSFSALLGWQKAASDKAIYVNNITGDDSSYLYWNAGVSFGFLEKWSIDFRYWDTNIDKQPGFGSCSIDLFSCDQRFVATLKFTY